MAAAQGSPRGTFRPKPPPQRDLAASGSLDRSRLLRSPEPPRVLPRQGTHTGPILTDKHGTFPRRGESHVLPASQKGPMMPQRLRCLNPERSQQTLTAAKPPFTPHMPVPVCSALTPRHLLPQGVTENVFSIESIEGVGRSTPEPNSTARLSSPARQADHRDTQSSSAQRGRGIGHDIYPWSASHSMPSWEPTAQVGVKVTAERRADRFKSGEAVVPAMPNEHIPHYYASSGPGDELGETVPDADRRGTGGSKTGEEWLEDATALPAQTQFTRQRSGFNVPGSSDDGFRVARARRQFYEQVRQLGPCRSERGFGMARTPPAPRPGAVTQRASQTFKLSGGIALASEESFPTMSVTEAVSAVEMASVAAPAPPKTTTSWRDFKSALHAQREPTMLVPPAGAPRVLPQWPPREMITFRSCVERGLLPVAGNEPATIDAGLPRSTIIARQFRQF